MFLLYLQDHGEIFIKKLAVLSSETARQTDAQMNMLSIPENQRLIWGLLKISVDKVQVNIVR